MENCSTIIIILSVYILISTKIKRKCKNLFYKLLDSAIPLPLLTEPAVRVSWCLVKVVFEACFLGNFPKHVYAITAVAFGAVGCSIQTFLNEGRLLSKSETIEYVSLNGKVELFVMPSNFKKNGMPFYHDYGNSKFFPSNSSCWKVLHVGQSRFALMNFHCWYWAS